MSRLRLVVLVCWGLCSLGLPAGAAAARRLHVLTSFLPVYCLTANVAGSLAEVENLLPANVEPHDYQFSRKDLQKLAAADLVVINGLGVEKWLENAIKNSSSLERLRVVELAAGLHSELIYPVDEPGNREWGRPGRPNPHIWLDPALARHGITNILGALQKADPANAGAYSANAARYVVKLDQLESELHQALRPFRGAALVSYHDAFAYFARRFGLNVIGVVEPLPETDPSLKHLASLYHSIRANRVRAIFTEPPAPSRLARQIASDLHLRLGQLDTLESGPPRPEAYELSMRENLRVLLTTLIPDAQAAAR